MKFETDQSELWRSDESLRELGCRLAAKPLNIRVVSFDFFDTLVCRLCAQPSDLFLEVGRQLAERDMLLQPMSSPEFRAARISADERARRNAADRKQSTEIQLADIYRELRMVVREPAAAQNVEFEIERGFCYLNPAVASFVRYVRSLGLRTAIVSDTYFTLTELKRLLRDHNLSTDLFDEIFVSCERGRAKWNGQLYHDLFRHFDIHPSELLHIGDNPHADIHMAKELNVDTALYYKTTPDLDLIFNGERSMHGVAVSSSPSLNSLRVLVARQAKSDQDAFRDGALVFGPVLARFADWAVEHFRAAGTHTVLALMREGELLGELVERAAASAGYELKVATCYASRLATGRAGVPELNLERAQELLEGCGAYTIQAVLNILGLGQDALQFLSPEHRSRPLFSSADARELLTCIFRVPKLCQLLEQKRAQSHELAFEYLNGLIGEESTVAFLDLGWSGTIQRNVGRILRQGGRELRTLGCYLASTNRAGRMPLDGDAVHSYLDQDWDRSAILPEVAITAMVGSTDGYVRNEAGQVVPVLGSCEFSPEERRVKTRLRDGILAFQASWLDVCTAKGAKVLSERILAEIDRQSPATLYRLLEYPTKPEAERLGVLRHDENYFGQNYSAPLCDHEAAGRLRRDGMRAIFQAGKCYWPQGVVARSYPRLLTALRPRWDNPLALGRLGAWHNTPVRDVGITGDELSSLGVLANSMGFAQLVFAGPAGPALEELLLHLWQQDPNHLTVLAGKPRMVRVGPAGQVNSSPEFLARSTAIHPDPRQLSTLRTIRSQLVTDGDIALVFSSDTTPDNARALLNGLAPFLGPQGTILLARGRFDTTALEEDVPLASPVNQWFKVVGKELGYSLWFGPPAAKPFLCDWNIFRRTPQGYVWNKQWAFTGDDLACSDLALSARLATATTAQ